MRDREKDLMVVYFMPNNRLSVGYRSPEKVHTLTGWIDRNGGKWMTLPRPAWSLATQIIRKFRMSSVYKEAYKRGRSIKIQKAKTVRPVIRDARDFDWYVDREED